MQPNENSTVNLFESVMSTLWAAKTSPATSRVTDDEQGILAAMALCLRADCTRRRVGCVVTDSRGRVIGTGRNGSPPGRPGCLTDNACPRGRQSLETIKPGSDYSAGAGRCIALHAEINALLFSDPVARYGGTIYITDAPCDDCATALAGSGLHRAVWPQQTNKKWEIMSIVINDTPMGGWYS